ncbi:MAG: D-alanine--D-alanine ligase family protein [Alkalispirochaeta sp.]
MKVALLYGGRSTEHEVSLSSAAGVLRALMSHENMTVEPIGLARDGTWYYQDFDTQLGHARADEPLTIEERRNYRVAVLPAGGLAVREGKVLPVDCVIPILHGSFGEDGTLQGLLEMAGLPYVGSGVVGSAVGMDKMRSKQLWQDHGLPVVPYLHVAESDLPHEDDIRRLADVIEERLGYPVFVKPNAAGSSVGITRVSTSDDLAEALKRAFRVDRVVLIEQALSVREIETAVLGNDTPQAFQPGEVIPSHEFYDYDAKYEDPEGARLVIPADIPRDLADDIKALSVAAFRAIDGAGLSRVDCFVVSAEDGSQQIYLNEINTIPGFTPISMYPKMVEAGGISYSELVMRLIELAMERFRLREARDFLAR